jgi:hypothetical protein
MLLIAIFATLVCGWDVYTAVRGHNAFSWFLGALMAVIAIGAFRKLLRNDYSGSWW